MKGYKGFDANLKCRGKQYKIGKAESEETAKLCEKGLHFCEYPLDCFTYYPPSEGRYCEVDAEEVSDETGEDSKRVAKRMTVGAEIGLKGIVEAGVRFILKKSTSTESNTGTRSAATNTGDWSAATNTGDWSVALNTGYQSAVNVSGRNSVAIATGAEGRAAGEVGDAIVLCEYNDNGTLICIRSRMVDGVKIKANIPYTLKNGRIVKYKP